MSRALRAGSGTHVVGVRATDAERSLWERCAKGAGQSLSDWMRSLANHTARETAVASDRRRSSISRFSPPARTSSSKKRRS